MSFSHEPEVQCLAFGDHVDPLHERLQQRMAALPAHDLGMEILKVMRRLSSLRAAAQSRLDRETSSQIGASIERLDCGLFAQQWGSVLERKAAEAS